MGNNLRMTSDLKRLSMLALFPSTSAWFESDSIRGLSNGQQFTVDLESNESSHSIFYLSTPDHQIVIPSSSNNWQVFFLLIIEAAGILGNLLVCVSVAIERRLRTITNYILVSLAIADLFVSLIVMPGYIAHEYKGYWPFGLIMCTLWQMFDVTMCTSSIMHMCIISLDRYKCIRDPMSIRSRSKSSVALRISAVWFFAVMISTPLAFLAAFRPSDILNSKSECIISNPNFLVYGSIAAFFLPLIVMLITYSLTINLLRRKAMEIEQSGGLRRSVSNRRRRRSKRPHSPLRPTMSLNCEVSSNKWQYPRTSSTDGYSNWNGKHQIESKLTSLTSSSTEINKSTTNNIKLFDFKFPSTNELKRQTNYRLSKTQRNSLSSWKNVKKERLSEEGERIVETYFPVDVGPQNTDTSIAPLLRDSCFESDNEIKNRRRSISAGDLRSHHQKGINSSRVSNGKHSKLLSDLTSLRYYQLHSSNPKLTKKETLVHRSSASDKNSFTGQHSSNVSAPRNQTIKRIIELERNSDCSLDESTTLANNSNSCSDKNSDCIRADSDFMENTHSIPPLNRHHTVPVPVNNSHKKCRFLDDRNNRLVKCETLEEDQPNEFTQSSSKTNRRHKSISKTVTNERKAVKVLGLMFLMFVACWAIFFCVNFAMGVCPECKFDESLFKYLLWLGYTSSLINPIIYTVFNLSFRRAFIRILTCQYCRFKSVKVT